MTQSQTQDPGIIPDPSHDSKTFKKLLMQQVRTRRGTQAVDTKQGFQSLVKETRRPFWNWRWSSILAMPNTIREGRGGNSRNGAP